MATFVSDLAIKYGGTIKGLYYGTVALSFVLGACKGVSIWWDWLEQRKYRKITYPAIEPVVNAACDVGKLAYDVTSCSAASAAVAATAPISIPLIITYYQK